MNSGMQKAEMIVAQMESRCQQLKGNVESALSKLDNASLSDIAKFMIIFQNEVNRVSKMKNLASGLVAAAAQLKVNEQVLDSIRERIDRGEKF